LQRCGLSVVDAGRAVFRAGAAGAPVESGDDVLIVRLVDLRVPCCSAAGMTRRFSLRSESVLL